MSQQATLQLPHGSDWREEREGIKMRGACPEKLRNPDSSDGGEGQECSM